MRRHRHDGQANSPYGPGKNRVAEGTIGTHLAFAYERMVVDATQNREYVEGVRLLVEHCKREWNDEQGGDTADVRHVVDRTAVRAHQDVYPQRVVSETEPEHERSHAILMKRLPVNDGDDLELFEAKLNGAYDWLHKGQIAYKKLRAASRS